MAVPKKIINFLQKNKIKYEILEHRTVYTAFDKAQTLKVKPQIVGKTLVLKIDGILAVVLVPANKNLDKEKFKKVAKVKKFEFVPEKIIKQKLKGVKVGAIPPFGNLWTPPTRHPPASRAPLPTFVDRPLLNQPKIIVNGGDYNFSIKISGASLKKLVPDLVVGNFSKEKR
jgi:Ala-tRNA(Pro) deacylase